MKNIQYLIIIVFIFALGRASLNAQCLDFAKSSGFVAMDTAKYIPEGRLSALPVSEGDNMDVYKSFFKGKTYKIIVVAADNLPKPHFKVVNFQREVLYDSSVDGHTGTWEFTSQSNQNLIISAVLPDPKDRSNIQSGCLAVIVGFKN